MSERKSARGGWVNADLKIPGKTVLITGANSGIGLETAIDLARRGARIIIACRSLIKADEAKNRIIEESGNDNVVVKELDLASFASIRRLAQDINNNEIRLNILINNAGVLIKDFEDTEDGFEMHFGVNHLGTFLLTNLLLLLLKRSAPSRIVTVASSAHKAVSINWNDPNRQRNFNDLEAYSQSKLMNVLFSRELGKRLAGTGVTTYSLHPGIVPTGLNKANRGCCKCKHGGCLGCLSSFVYCMTCCHVTAEKGAQTAIYCAIAPELETVSGKYYSNCKITREDGKARNEADAVRLWDMSETFTGVRTSLYL